MTPSGVDSSPNVHMSSKPVKKPSARKSLRLFTNVLEINPKTAKRHFVAAKSRRKSTKECNSHWTKKKQKEKGIQKSMIRSNVTCNTQKS